MRGASSGDKNICAPDMTACCQRALPRKTPKQSEPYAPQFPVACMFSFSLERKSSMPPPGLRPRERSCSLNSRCERLFSTLSALFTFMLWFGERKDKVRASKDPESPCSNTLKKCGHGGNVGTHRQAPEACMQVYGYVVTLYHHGIPLLAPVQSSRESF